MALTDTLKTEASKQWWERARRVLAGGVSSPVRAFKAVGGTPLFMNRGEGPYLYDEDENRYLDFCNSWGPLILGHAHPEVLEAISHAMRHGTSFGAPCRLEVELAEKVAAWVPGAEVLRFVSSGTEAVMSAVRLARACTGRDRIVKFSGCYHGHADYLLVAAGSGLATLGRPDSAGVPRAFAECTLVAPLDDEAALQQLFREHGSDIAAVIIEPVPANYGLLLQRPEYLASLREITSRHGALLIFDEVITGFRLGRGGAAEHYQIRPDLYTFGKVIGGGLPVGGYAGSREHMSRLAPEGDVYQAGTLSGNPMAMAAGLATLNVLERQDGFNRLESLGMVLDRTLGSGLKERGLHYARSGSIFWTAFQSRPPRRLEDVDQNGRASYARLHRALLEREVYFAPSAFEVGFLSLAQSEEMLRVASEQILNAFDEAVRP